MTGTPVAVAHLVVVTHDFAVLLCVGPKCRHAQTVKGIAEHLRKVHHEKLVLRKAAEEFGWELAKHDARFLRGYADVELPGNGLAPQAIVPVVDGFSCRFCDYLTTSRANVRMHVSGRHSRPREEDEHILTRVRLQSWYGPKRERYWVVNDATDGLGEGTNGPGEATKNSVNATKGRGDATNC